jgi:uncharacterized membrane protein YhaH (DUF805 family)
MFYELLVNATPQGHWQPPSRGRNDVPAGIDQLIEAGLSNKASLRPQSVTQYAVMLAQAQKAGGLSGGGAWQKWIGSLETSGDFKKALEQLGKLATDGGIIGRWWAANSQNNNNQGDGGFKPPEQNKKRTNFPTMQSQVTFMNAFMYGLMKKYADGRGRASRTEYWGFMVGTILLVAIAGSIDTSTYGEAAAAGLAPSTIVTLLVLITPSIAVTSRRLHDLGYSGWLALITVVPLIGFLVGVPRGTVGDNQYGPDPLAAATA